MRIFFWLILFGMVITVRAQTLLNWSDLSEGISWELLAPGSDFPGFQKATFSSEMKALDGKPVLLIGYLLVLDGNQSVYLLSKNPMASCFFCGNGGPETIVDLEFVEKPNFLMDDVISVEGKLRLNKNNPNASYYRIEDAEAARFN